MLSQAFYFFRIQRQLDLKKKTYFFYFFSVESLEDGKNVKSTQKKSKE